MFVSIFRREKIMRCYIPPVLLLMSSICYSAEDRECRLSQLEKEMDEVSMKTVFCNYGAKPANGDPLISGSGWSANASLLAWHLFEGRTDFAIITENTPFTFNSTQAKTARVNFDWGVGYRAGIGYNFFYDPSACSDWDIQFTYTYFYASKTERASFVNDFPVSDGVVAIDFPPFISGQITYDTGSSSRRIRFSSFDLDLARSFFVSRSVSFRPFIGLKGALIFQRLNAKYNDSLQSPLDTQLAHNDFRGIGIKGGTDASLYFNSNWSIFDSFSGGLLFGKFHLLSDLTSTDQVTTGLQISAGSLKTSINRIVPEMQNTVGLSWESDIRDSHSHISLKLGYEFQYWWSQNQFVHYLDGLIYLFTRLNDDLAMHGVSFDLSFDF